MTPFLEHYLYQTSKLRATHYDRRDIVWHALASTVAFGCFLLLVAEIPLPGMESLGISSAHASVGLAVTVGVVCCLYFALFDPLTPLLMALFVFGLWALYGGQDPLAGVSGPMRVGFLLAVYFGVELIALAGNVLFHDRTVLHPPALGYHRVSRVVYHFVFGGFHYYLFLLLELGYRPALRQVIADKARVLAEDYV
jgi:hypothetical protein